MLKKLIVTTTCLLLGFSAYAEKPSLQISGSFEGYYKNQDSYKSPWDEGDTVEYIKDSSGVKQAANHRDTQHVRQEGSIDFLGILMGDGYPQFITYMTIELNPETPDYVLAKGDAVVGVGEFWAMYKPHMAVNIKLGVQTIIPTVNNLTTHSFMGDIDTDFSVVKLASALTGASGLSVSGYLGSADYELGVSVLNGVSGVDGLFGIKGVENEGAANTTVLWFNGKFGDLIVSAAQQTTIANTSYKKRDSITDLENQYDKSIKYSGLNFAAKYDLGMVKPFVEYISFAGESTIEIPLGNFDAYTDTKLVDGSGKPEVSMMTVGVEFEAGPGTAAISYTQNSSLGLDNKNSAIAVVDHDSTIMSEFKIKLNDSATLYAFYHSMKTNGTIKKVMENLKSAGIPSSQWSLLEQSQWSDTTSMGVGFSMSFGG